MAIVTIRGRVDEISPVYRVPKPRQLDHFANAASAPPAHCEVTETYDEVRIVISEVNPGGTYGDKHEVLVQDSLAEIVSSFKSWKLVDEIRVMGLLNPDGHKVNVHNIIVRLTTGQKIYL